MNLFKIILIFSTVAVSFVKADCGGFWDTPCDTGLSSANDEQIDDGSGTGTSNIYSLCCPDGSEELKDNTVDLNKCYFTNCFNSTSYSNGNDLCKYHMRLKDRKDYGVKEVNRGFCDLNGVEGSGGGITAFCCPPDNKEATTALLLGAERHQFPFFAMVTNEGGYCGGAVYNERYIITAAHCIASSSTLHDFKTMKVYLDVELGKTDNPDVYNVSALIPFPNSTILAKEGELIYDIALIKLDRDIKFSGNIKAIPLAEEGFDPLLYSDQAVILGLGRTDTDAGSNLLQRARVYFRPELKAPNIIRVGGTDQENNRTSPIAGAGDSGGPMICRDGSGMAVLCGVTSATGCESESNVDYDKEECAPAFYEEVSFYSKWIREETKGQENAPVLKQGLFGEPVPEGKYEHQVRITSDGDPCGGTLIERDLVLTAAHCIENDYGEKRNGIEVWVGIRDLKKDKGERIEVREVLSLDEFGRSPSTKELRPKRIAKINTKPSPKYPFYKNDLALLKLTKEVDIKEEKLPKIGKAVKHNLFTDNEIVWAKEIALPVNTTFKSRLEQRDFMILEHEQCQSRLDRASFEGHHITLDDNVMCGEERFNGGAQCDRELGGGLICKGEDGKDILCGVQVFRFCQLALPSGFLDINLHQDWIDRAKSQL